MRFDSCTTPIQQLYNNPSHEGGPQFVEPTLMWGIIVQLLYWCCKSNIFFIKFWSNYNFKGFVTCTTYSHGVGPTHVSSCAPSFSQWKPNQSWTDSIRTHVLLAACVFQIKSKGLYCAQYFNYLYYICPYL